MLTDPFFHQFFKQVPNLIRDLIVLDNPEEYRFTSESVKTPTHRIDGVFRSSNPNDPIIFLEAQGYQDPYLYDRAFNEVLMLRLKEKWKVPFIIVFLFLETKFDLDNSPVDVRAPNQLEKIYLRSFLEQYGPKLGPWAALKPLFCEDEQTLRQEGQAWREQIEAAQISSTTEVALLQLLISTIGEKFKKLSKETIMEILQMPALKNTRIAKEYAAEGKQEGIAIGEKQGIAIGERIGKKIGIEIGEKRGEKIGEWIGKIRTAQEFLGVPMTPKSELKAHSLNELKAMYEDLKPHK